MKTNCFDLQAAFGPRVVTLRDGRPGLRGALPVETHAPPHDPATAPGAPQPAILDFIASDETLDRYDEIVSASGWRLEAYRRNPVFQNAHQYGDILFTLGKALITEIREGRLYQRIEFAVDANPVSRIAFRLYSGGFLNGVSIGFIPLRWETGGDQAGFKRRFIEQELLEVSAVAIPANPNALQLALKAGALDKADLRDALDLLRMLCDPARSGSTAPSANVPAPTTGNTRNLPLSSQPTGSGVESDPEYWLGLARQLRSVLRGA